MAFVIKQRGAGGKISIHVAQSVHRPGRTPCHVRQHLGVLDPETNELVLAKGKPEPDDGLLELLAAKGVVYKGRRAPDRRRSAAVVAGPATSGPCGCGPLRLEELGRTAVLCALARESGLLDALREAFGEAVGGRLLVVAMHQVCEGAPLYMTGEWADAICGGAVGGLSAPTVAGLVRDVGADLDARRRFSAAWIRACGMPKALVHDTTSLSTYAALDGAEWGYNRDGDDLPQLNLALVAARDSRVPIWYRTIPGSVPDVSSLKATAALLTDLGLTDFSFTLDRGYFSSGNVADMLEKGIRFTIGVPLHLKQAKAALKAKRRALTAFKRAFLAEGSALGHAEWEYVLTRGDGTQTALAAHLYFNRERQAQSAARLGKIVLELKERADRLEFEGYRQAKDWIAENAGAHAKYLAPGRDGERHCVRIKYNRVSAATANFGVTMILTSNPADAPRPDHEDVLADYRSRDMAEKIFDAYKNATGNDRIRTGKTDSAEGRVFLAFLAVTLRSLFENRLRETSLKRSVNVPEALARLAKIRRLVPVNGAPLLLEVPRKSRELAEAIGFRPEDMISLATGLGLRAGHR